MEPPDTEETLVATGEAELTHDLAEAIRNVSEAAKRLERSGLTRRAIVLLIQDTVGPALGKRDINDVLDALPRLRGRYLTDNGD